MTQKQKLKYLIIFIIGVVIVSTLLFVIYNLTNNANAIELNHVDINSEEIITVNDLEIYGFEPIYNEDSNKWYVKIFFKNVSDEKKDINDFYVFQYYDQDNNLIKEMEDKILFNLENQEEIMYLFGLNFDGSKIKSISLKEK